MRLNKNGRLNLHHKAYQTLVTGIIPRLFSEKSVSHSHMPWPRMALERWLELKCNELGLSHYSTKPN